MSATGMTFGLIFLLLAASAAGGATITLTPEDTYVEALYPDTNFGKNGPYEVWDLYVGDENYNDPATKTRTYMKFSLSTIPSGATILSAKIYLRAIAVGPNPAIVVGAYYLDNDSWDQYTLTWNNQPATGHASTPTATQTVNNTQWYAWEVASDVQHALDKDGVFSVVMREDVEGSDHNWCNFPSEEADWYPAYMQVDYVVPDEEVDIAIDCDAYVEALYPTTNFGNAYELYVGDENYNEPATKTRSFIKVDLEDTLPPGVQIVSAMLNVRTWGIGPNPPIAVGAHKLTSDAWLENTITWNNQPTSFDPTATDTKTITNTATWYAWNVTADVQEAYAGDGVYSAVLKEAGEGTDHNWCGFSSSEEPYGFGPYLAVGYVAAGPIPDIKANGSDGPLTLPSSQTVNVTVSLDPGGEAGNNHDWWILAQKSGGNVFSWVLSLPGHWTLGVKRAYMGPLFTLNSYSIHNGTMPIGSWGILFCVDAPDNTYQGTYKDSIQITVY